jgi:hypothetical protein
MLTVIDKWKPKVINVTNVIIGRTAVELINSCHKMECNIGNLIADSFVYYVSNFELKVLFNLLTINWYLRML